MIGTSLLTVTAVLLFSRGLTVSALPEISWTAPNVTIGERVDQPNYSASCTKLTVKLVDTNQSNITTTLKTSDVTGCIVRGKDVDLFINPSRLANKYAVRYHSDTTYTSVQLDDRITSIELVPDTNIVHFIYERDNEPTDLSIATIKDITKELERSSPFNDVYYSFDAFTPSQNILYWMKTRGTDRYGTLKTVELSMDFYTTSKNGRYLYVVAGGYRAIAIIDTFKDKDQVRVIGSGYPKEGTTKSIRYPGLVNDSGTKVFTGAQLLYIDTSNDCGTILTDNILLNLDAHVDIFNDSCPIHDIENQITQKIGYESITVPLHFDDNEHSIIAYTGKDRNWDSPRTLVTLNIGADASKKLDYLALGDSYSSGEGDDKWYQFKSPYINSVETKENDCHISPNSYPYLLMDFYSWSKNNAISIACSGAKVDPDYFGSVSDYLGQGERLKNKPDIDTLKIEALNEFIPGRTPQLEFVKKYQPKHVTLTAAGNDVNFSKVLESCAGLSVKNCDYATYNSITSKKLNNLIDSQYKNVYTLITYIQYESPETEITLVGYPKFIVEGDISSLCWIDYAGIVKSERAAINQAFDRLNDVLVKVAANSGVIYIDNADTLNGGRICEGGKYVTGLGSSSQIPQALKENVRELFHPNAKGHRKIADKIITTQNQPITYPYKRGIAPPKPATPTYSKDIILLKAAKRDAVLPVDTEKYLFEPFSSVRLEGHSDPVDLGTYTTDEQGGLKANLSLKGLPSGVHMLVYSGKSYSGEPLEYVQFITIYDNENDTDGDGIPNSKDNCEFINVWIDEQSGIDQCGPLGNISKERARIDQLKYSEIYKKDHVSELSTNLKNNRNTNNDSSDKYNDKSNKIYQTNWEKTNINKGDWRVLIALVIFILVSLTSILLYKVSKRKSQK